MKARFEHIDDYVEQADVLLKDNFSDLREQAANDLRMFGFPAAKTEAWKYTSIKGLLKNVYTPAEKSTLSTEQVAPYLLEKAYSVVFVNGFYDAGLSSIDSTAISLLSISEATDLLGQLIPMQQAGFTALNSMLFQQGYYLSISASLDKPIHILHCATDVDDEQMIQQRNFITVAKNCHVEVLEQFIAFDSEQAYWRNIVTECIVAEKASLDYYKVSQEADNSSHTSFMVVQQAEQSIFNAFNADLSGKLLRHDLHTRLQAENARCQLNGVYLARGAQHIDSHTNIEHLHPYTFSQEYYKGIVDDKAHAVFNGRVLVAADAQKVDSAQKNSNLLLSNTAEIDTKPELEIYADDVKCAHGATVGQLDAGSVFYLQSRGIEKALAKKILTYGFAYEVIEMITNITIRDFIGAQLATWFVGDDQLKDIIQ